MECVFIAKQKLELPASRFLPYRKALAPLPAARQAAVSPAVIPSACVRFGPAGEHRNPRFADAKRLRFAGLRPAQGVPRPPMPGP